MGIRPCGSEVNRGPHGSEVNRENHKVLRGKEEDHTVLKESREDHVVLGCFFFATRLRQQERLCSHRKGEKGLLLVGHEKVPHGFGLTGDCSSHTADGAGSLNHRLLLLS